MSLKTPRLVSARSFRVVPLSFDGTMAGRPARESMPVLVDAMSGVPAVLPLRWVVRELRNTLMPNTISDALRAVGALYAWMDVHLRRDADSYLAEGGMLTPSELQHFAITLRDQGGQGEAGDARVARSLARVGRLTPHVRAFLYWTAVPQDRGSGGFLGAAEALRYFERLVRAFAAFERHGNDSDRIEPLDPIADAWLRDLVSPARPAKGPLRPPFRWNSQNPWQASRLRNWLMYYLARELGLRRGELLKLRIDDITRVGAEQGLYVRRRPNDIADRRRHKPSVKTVSRPLPISPSLVAALRVYQSTPLEAGGRLGADTPYLFVSDEGAALSESGADEIWKTARKRLPVGIPRVSWHTMRHTWAEEIARDLMLNNDENADKALGILRMLGGWSPTSNTPYHYIQHAMREGAFRYLRERAERLFQSESNS